ncbi:uridine phosphorylase [Celerinatantimonas sp. YJH-8]|uniref:uridine phosphorylase n=1 Tax=Celerinatantimonas sp. YJH-8 TaxID=3228714 RepID=UPI0038BEC93A
MGQASVFHLGLNEHDIAGATLAIIPGDPARVERIAGQLERSQILARTREFTSARAYLGDVPIIICSTGIGGPSTSIAVEELAQLGIRTFLRVGTTGAIAPHIQVGDLIITTGSVRLDGASQHFAPLEYPAVADFYATQALVRSAEQLGYQAHVGITASSDTFYPGQERYDTYTGRVNARFRGSLKEWQSLGVLNYEMESATLLTMCASSGLKAAMIAGVIVNRAQQEIPDETLMAQTEQRAVTAVIAAARQLLA